MKFKTAISTINTLGEHTIKGQSLVDLIEHHSFTDVIFLLFRGTFPNQSEASLLNALLVASVEHGIEVPSLFVPRVTVSTGNPIHVALASGVLTLGERHGGAAEKAAELFKEDKAPQDIVSEYLAAKKAISGFGHKIYKDEDPRATTLFKKTKELGFAASYFEKAYAIEKALAAQKGKKLPLNIDGAMACVLLELGFSEQYGKVLFILSRLVGMAAHVVEEQNQSQSYHRLDSDDVEFNG